MRQVDSAINSKAWQQPFSPSLSPTSQGQSSTESFWVMLQTVLTHTSSRGRQSACPTVGCAGWWLATKTFYGTNSKRKQTIENLHRQKKTEHDLLFCFVFKLKKSARAVRQEGGKGYDATLIGTGGEFHKMNTCRRFLWSSAKREEASKTIRFMLWKLLNIKGGDLRTLEAAKFNKCFSATWMTKSP